MKRFFYFGAMLAAIAVLFSACNKEDFSEEASINKEVIVSIGLGGELLDIDYVPMSKASEGNDIYGIQVYSCPNTEGEPTWKNYAYGLFDDTSKMSIKLLTGYKYKFVASMVVDGKTRLRQTKFCHPFYLSGNNTGDELLNNSFYYQVDAYMQYLGGGSTYIEDDIYSVPNVERYYGELEGYIPTDGGNAEIEMGRTSFAAKFIAQGNFKKDGGQINIAISNAPVATIVYDENNNEHKVENIYTFPDVRAAYLDKQYTQTMDVTLSWTKADGATIPFGTYQVNFRRNKQTVVTIKAVDKSSDNSIGVILDQTTIDVGDQYVIDPGGSTDNSITPTS